MHYKKTFMVARSAQAAIDFIGDFNNLPQWDGSIRQVRQTVGSGVGREAEYHVAVAFSGNTIVMRYRTVAYEPGCRIVLEGKSGVAHAVDSIHAEETEEGTRVTYVADIRVHGWKGRWLDPLLRFMFGFNVNRAVANLQRLLSVAGEDQGASRSTHQPPSEPRR